MFLRRRRPDAAAEKLADLELDDRAADGWQSAVLDAAVEVPELCKPDAALSAARSFSGRELEDAEAELELLDAQLVRLELTAAHSLPAAGPQEHSPPAVPLAEQAVLLESLAEQQLWLGLPAWAVLPGLPDAALQQLAAEPEPPALRPQAQPALLPEPEELLGAAEREPEAELLPVAAY